jgi:indolepyruvate ferredoxin oxidoreductase
LRILLAPPLFAGRDPDTGEPKKIAVPGAILPLFRILAAARFLRGTVFDPFRHTADRRLDRALILEYESILEKLLAGLSKETHALAIEIASVPDTIRGFGHVRSRSVVQARSRWSELMPRYRGAASAQAAVASRGEV